LGGIGYEYLMIDKTVETLQDAVSVIEDGAVILISGFGKSGNPTELAHALIDHGSDPSSSTRMGGVSPMRTSL
jgi:acyl CoA:acetate/3-ketoacid CoA transferase